MHTKVMFNNISNLSCFGKHMKMIFVCVSTLCEKYNDN